MTLFTKSKIKNTNKRFDAYLFLSLYFVNRENMDEIPFVLTRTRLRYPILDVTSFGEVKRSKDARSSTTFVTDYKFSRLKVFGTRSSS